MAERRRASATLDLLAGKTIAEVSAHRRDSGSTAPTTSSTSSPTCRTASSSTPTCPTTSCARSSRSPQRNFTEDPRRPLLCERARGLGTLLDAPMSRPTNSQLEAIEKLPGVKALDDVSFAAERARSMPARRERRRQIDADADHRRRHRADAGRILVRGKASTSPSPRSAPNLGIAMVYQDTRLVPDLDVAQNIWLGREPGGLFVDRRHGAETRGTSSRVSSEDLPLGAPSAEIAVAERQIVELARALTLEPAHLILDEPTSALDPRRDRPALRHRPRLKARDDGRLHLAPPAGSLRHRRPHHGAEGRAVVDTVDAADTDDDASSP